MKHFTKDKPQFEHDCDCTAFLGRYICSRGKNWDLYYCKDDVEGPALIGRSGDAGNYCCKPIGTGPGDFQYSRDSAKNRFDYVEDKCNYLLGNNRIYTEIVDRIIKFGLITSKKVIK